MKLRRALAISILSNELVFFVHAHTFCAASTENRFGETKRIEISVSARMMGTIFMGPSYNIHA